MKKRILAIAALQIFMVLGSCSSDSGSESEPTPEPPVVIIKTPKITSYSKNSGETGETISINGENFSEKVSDIKITFDGVAATIVSATATEIKVTLPKTEKVQPKFELTIENKVVSNDVKNDYNQNIGILPLPSTTGWFTIENVLKSDIKIKRVQMISDKIFYLIFDGNVYRTLDGGISWKKWAYSYSYDGVFWATKNGAGLAYTLFGAQNSSGGVMKIPTEGDITSSNNLWKEPGGAYPGIMSVYTDEDMKNGTVVSQKGGVYTNTNGGNFELVYDLRTVYPDARINNGAEIDNNHIWTIGIDKDSSLNSPLILYKNNTTDGWKQNVLKNESGFRPYEICFPDTENGFVLISSGLAMKIYKTKNGGDTWESVYSGDAFAKFAFKDANTGWAIADTKIYKTIDGGKSWTVDYTNDQPIRNIAYKNNVVWAISKDKIIKRYL